MDRAAVEALARANGFDHLRVARVGPDAVDGAAFDRWIEAGRHATMAWMAQHRDARLDPTTRLPTARSALVLTIAHHHRRPPDPGGLTGMVARYAWGRDYHNLVGRRLRKLRRALDHAGVPSWGGVDSAPILERAWARAAGAGFQGKNTLIISPGRTSYFFLAVVFVPLDIAPDAPVGDHCGRCTQCISGCPTAAFPSPWVLDANRCVSYWTIEADTMPPPDLRAGFGRWVFGCDVCQEVCPHNHHPDDPDEDDLLPRHAWLDLAETVLTPDDALILRTTGTPLRRAAPRRLKRNALLVLGNLARTEAGAIGRDEALRAVRHALTHDAPVVRQAAVWASSRFDGGLPASDPDPLVDAEIRRCADMSPGM